MTCPTLTLADLARTLELLGVADAVEAVTAAVLTHRRKQRDSAA